MRRCFLILALGFSFTTAFGNDRKDSPNGMSPVDGSDTSEVVIQKTVDLSDNFKVELGMKKVYPTYTNFGYIRLVQNSTVVYSDSLNEYECDNELYPILLKTDDTSYELLVEVTDRPNKNYLLRMSITKGKVVKTDKLPTFIAKPTDLNGDGVLEYAGYWAFNETWGEDKAFTDYNPILYYSITKSGLKISYGLTKEMNTTIYGTFHGFEYSQNIDIPANALELFNKEVSRIEQSGK